MRGGTGIRFGGLGMQSSKRRASKRRRGNAVVAVLVLLLIVAAALGGNYVRNAQADAQDEKKSRPYAKYQIGDLEVLAEGYRMELATAEKRHGGRRVSTRTRHHFRDQVQEFERVQRETRKVRDQAIEVAQVRADLKEIEDEISGRQTPGSGAKLHLERMFRF